jgi:hypothetical protein
MGDDSSGWEQPDWYKLAVAAKWLGMPAPDLNNLEEPDRTYWLNRGMAGHNAEAEANRPKQQQDA